MHPYATDSSERKFVPLYLAGISILTAWIFNGAVGYMQFTLPWWVNAPSIIGFYGLLQVIFDKCLWRWQILRTIGVVKVPDLNGTWKGHLASSFDDHSTKQDATIKISQRWTQISIILETNHSKSHSSIAAISIEDPTDVVLSYEYLNDPMPNAKRSMHIHRGTGRLTIQPGGKTFEGEYYTNSRDRQNFGTLTFERQEH